LVYDQTKILAQPRKKIGSEGSIPCLVCHDFYKGFFLFNGVSGKKKPFKPFFGSFISKKNGFLPNKT